MSEKSIPRQQAGLVRLAKTSCRNPATSLGPALVANSLCSGQEKRTMCQPEVQIGNSCAGINRHAAEDERALRERGSDPLDPEFCAGHREVHGEA